MLAELKSNPHIRNELKILAIGVKVLSASVVGSVASDTFTNESDIDIRGCFIDESNIIFDGTFLNTRKKDFHVTMNGREVKVSIRLFDLRSLLLHHLHGDDLGLYLLKKDEFSLIPPNNKLLNIFSYLYCKQSYILGSVKLIRELCLKKAGNLLDTREKTKIHFLRYLIRGYMALNDVHFLNYPIKLREEDIKLLTLPPEFQILASQLKLKAIDETLLFRLLNDLETVKINGDVSFDIDYLNNLLREFVIL